MPIVYFILILRAYLERLVRLFARVRGLMAGDAAQPRPPTGYCRDKARRALA
jgi:hypothetical protein